MVINKGRCDMANQSNKQSSNQSKQQQQSHQGQQQQGDNTSNRGFAGMDPERQRQIASEGGRAAHASGNAHEFTSEEARKAGAQSHKNDSGASRQQTQSDNQSGKQQGQNQKTSQSRSNDNNQSSNKQSR